MKFSLLVLSFVIGSAASIAQAQVRGCISAPGMNMCVGPNGPSFGPGFGPGHGGPGWGRPGHGGPGHGGPGGPDWGRPGHGGPGHGFPPGPPHRPPGGPGFPPPPPPPPQDQYVQEVIRINNFYAGTRLSLIQLLGDRCGRLEGSDFESIQVYGRDNGRGASLLTLLVNGYVEDRQYLQGSTMLRATHQFQLGRYGAQLELGIDQPAYIESIVITGRVRYRR